MLDGLIQTWLTLRFSVPAELSDPNGKFTRPGQKTGGKILGGFGRQFPLPVQSSLLGEIHHLLQCLYAPAAVAAGTGFSGDVAPGQCVVIDETLYLVLGDSFASTDLHSDLQLTVIYNHLTGEFNPDAVTVLDRFYLHQFFYNFRYDIIDGNCPANRNYCLVNSFMGWFVIPRLFPLCNIFHTRKARER